MRGAFSRAGIGTTSRASVREPEGEPGSSVFWPLEDVEGAGNDAVCRFLMLLDAAFGRVVRHARNVIVMRVWLAGHVESRRGPYTWPSQRGPSAAAE